MQKLKIKMGNIRFMPTGIGQLDRALGGGLVKGGVYLIHGPAGIGKTTLSMQILASMTPEIGSALLVSGEQTEDDLKRMKQRLGIRSRLVEVAEAVDGNIEPHLSGYHAVVVADQMYSLAWGYRKPGTTPAIKHLAAELHDFAKKNDTAVILLAHEGRDRRAPGPRFVHHRVDAVFRLGRVDRVLQANDKNRYAERRIAAAFELGDAGEFVEP